MRRAVAWRQARRLLNRRGRMMEWIIAACLFSLGVLVLMFER